MRREFWWDDGLHQFDAPLAAKSDEDREREQAEKTKRRFQDEDNRKVKPDAVGIGVPEEESRPASTDEDEHYAAEIEYRRHEQAPEEQRGRAMPEAFESARRLIPGKNKIESINGESRPEDPPKGGTPAWLAPDACIRFCDWLTRERTPARAESKCGKDEEQNARGELREKRASKAQGKPKSVLFAGLIP